MRVRGRCFQSMALAACLAAAAATAGEAPTAPGGSAESADGGQRPAASAGGFIPSISIIKKIEQGALDEIKNEKGERITVFRNHAAITFKGPVVDGVEQDGLFISARNIAFNRTTFDIYAEGDVLFRDPSGSTFQCDQISFNPNTWEGLTKNVRIKGERGDLDIPVVDFLDERPKWASERELNLDQAATDRGLGTMRRMYVQADEMRLLNQDHYEVIGAKITPSGFASPHWYFGAQAAHYRRGEKIESYNNTVRIGKDIPVMYFPYLIRDLKYDWPWMQASAGFTHDWGAFLRTKWGWRLQPDPEAMLRLNQVFLEFDLLTRRGGGAGVEFLYEVGHSPESSGKLRLYDMSEYWTSSARDLERANTEADAAVLFGHPGEALYRKDDRYAIEWEHYQRFNDYWDLRLQAAKYHDRDFLREYEDYRYRTEKEPQTSFDLRRLDQHWVAELVAQVRVNDWQNQAEYLPEARVTVPGVRIPHTPIFWEQDLRAGWVNFRYDEDAGRYGYLNELQPLDAITKLDLYRLRNAADYGTFFRAHGETRFDMPLHVADLFTVTPWVAANYSYFGKTVGTPVDFFHLSPAGQAAWLNNTFVPEMMPADGGGKTDWTIPWGVELSSKIYTTYGQNMDWRWVLEPTIGFADRPSPRLDYSTQVFPIDEVDWGLYRSRTAYFSLHNRIQQKTAEGIRDLLEFGVRAAYYPRTYDWARNHFPREADQSRLNSWDRHWTDIEGNVLYHPTRRLSLGAGVFYDPYDSRLNKANATLDWRFGGRFRLHLGHYYRRADTWQFAYWQPMPPSWGTRPGTVSETVAALRTKLWDDNSKYAIEIAGAYDWTDDRPWARHISEYRFTLFRDLDTFELAITYAANLKNNDHGLYFQLAPQGFMGKARPAPIYSSRAEEVGDGRYTDPTSFAALPPTARRNDPDAALKQFD